MNLNGDKIKVNKSVAELYTFLSNPSNFELIMPENISKFEETEYGFKFALKGMPEVGLKYKEGILNEKVELIAASGSLDFGLVGNLEAIDDNTSTIQLLFEGKLNPMLQMMVKKPLQSFVNSLTENLQNL